MKKRTLKALKNQIFGFTDKERRNIVENFVKITIEEFEELTIELGIAASINAELINPRTGRKYTITIKSENIDEEQEELEKAISN
jgi:hypothetical protein